MDTRVVVVTGAKGGLGSFVTNAFLNDGARVAGVSRSIRDSDFAHPNFAGIAAEISTAEAAEAMTGAVLKRLGRIDALVHLIGGFAGGKSAAETDDATWEQMMSLNLRTAVNAIRAVLPRLTRSGFGRIVAIGSRAAADPPATLSAYSASKAALVSFIRTVAAENKDAGITANIVLPGTMDTPANRAAMPSADFSKWVQPASVASLLVWLASPEASQVTGAVIPIYGRE